MLSCIIYAESWTGTGWALKDGYIVTNFHCVDGAKEIVVRGQIDYNAKVVAIDKINDLKNAASGIGDLLGFGGGGASYGMGAGTITGAGGGDTIFNITINGNVDSDARINQLKEDFASILDGETKESETVVG